MDRGAWQAAVHGHVDSDTTDQLTLSRSLNRDANLCTLILTIKFSSFLKLASLSFSEWRPYLSDILVSR